MRCRDSALNESRLRSAIVVSAAGPRFPARRAALAGTQPASPHDQQRTLGLQPRSPEPLPPSGAAGSGASLAGDAPLAAPACRRAHACGCPASCAAELTHQEHQEHQELTNQSTTHAVCTPATARPRRRVTARGSVTAAWRGSVTAARRCKRPTAGAAGVSAAPRPAGRRLPACLCPPASARLPLPACLCPPACACLCVGMPGARAHTACGAAGARAHTRLPVPGVCRCLPVPGVCLGGCVCLSPACPRERA